MMVKLTDPIGYLELSVRARKCLKYDGVNTIFDLFVHLLFGLPGTYMRPHRLTEGFRMIVPLIAPFMHIATEDGDVEIREEDLSVITDAELRMLRISREELRRCFGEAMEMMRGATQADWVQARPVAVPLNRKWEVHATTRTPVP